MSMVLKRIGRAELVRQLESCRDGIPHEKSEVVILNSSGFRSHVVKVEEDERGIFLCTCDDRMSEFLELARFVGSKAHKFDLEELIGELSKLTSDDVWIGWSGGESHTVVGKVLAVGTNEKEIVSMFPVPEDIEAINEEVRAICSRRCENARTGMSCGDCELCGICQILKDADEEITKSRRNGR